MISRVILAALLALTIAAPAHAQTKFYFHDAATPNVGTMPGGSTMSTVTPGVTATGAGTNRDMNQTLGTAQVGVTINTLGQSSLQRNWFRRFVSRPLAAQTLPTGAWTIAGGAEEGHQNSNMLVWGAVIKVWRPSTGTTVATLIDNPQLGTTEASDSGEGHVSTSTGSIAGVAVNEGDVLVIELWAQNSQQGGASRTNTIYYDGTTEASTTSNAAFLQAPGAITFHRSLRQSGYRFFNNADSTNVGTTLAAQNAAATLAATGDAFRLRVLVHVDDINLAISGQSFKLQFVGKGSGTCAAPSSGTPAAWTDVTAATVIAYNNNATPADGAALTANANDPAHSGHTVVNQTYEEANNFTNTAAINAGQDGKWDFSLRDNGAAASTTYCLRVVKSTGTALDTYLFLPEITTAAASALGGFNAYDTATAAGAITGNITTKVAGSSTSVAVIALNAAKTAIQTGFAGTVRVEVLDASNNSGALDANGCRPTWSVIQTLSPDPTFVAGDNGRKNVSFTQANSYRNVRLRVTYPVGAPTATGCSNDNFAIRPNAFANVAVTDSTWDTAGTTRTLDNTVATGGVVHKAGRPFTLRADAVNAAGAPAITTNYALTPDASVLSDCGASSACPSTFGTLTIGASFASGQLNSTAASYSEVGSFALQLVDAQYASVDNADSSAAQREIRSGTINVGRFVPDHFAFTNPGTPQFRTFDTAACAGRSFTYVGQPFGYVTVPTARVEARNAAGTITANYAGSLFKLVGASLSQTYSMTGKTINPALQPAVLSGSGAGFATYTAHASDKIAFNRDTTSADAPFNATIALTWVAEDSSENAASQGVITTSPSFVFNAIGFDAGTEFRYGRLRLANANGSQLASLPVLMEVQYRNSVGAFVTNTADSCTSIASQAVSMTFTPNLVPSPNCKTLLSGGGQFSSGRRTLVLSAPGNGNQGAATLTVNLNGAGSTTTCTVAGPPAAALDAALPWLRGNWTTSTFTQDATGRETFGAFPGAGEVIFIRENF